MNRRPWAPPAPAEPGAPPATPLRAAPTAPARPPERLGPFTLHPPVGDGDQQLLFAAYASSRQDDADLTSRHPESRRAVIEHEFESRQRSYPINFPRVEFFLLRLGGEPAGRVYLQLTPESVFVVDLVLLSGCRGRGHGSALLRDLVRQAHGSGRAVRLHVAKTNARAAALYQRLGFRAVEELAQHFLLELAPHP